MLSLNSVFGWHIAVLLCKQWQLFHRHLSVNNLVCDIFTSCYEIYLRISVLAFCADLSYTSGFLKVSKARLRDHVNNRLDKDSKLGQTNFLLHMMKTLNGKAKICMRIVKATYMFYIIDK